MVAKTQMANNTKHEEEEDEEEDEDDNEPCKKMKPLHLIQDNRPNNHHNDEQDEEYYGEEEDDENEEEDDEEGVKPFGEVLRVSWQGGHKKKHFKAFHFNGFLFQLEDPVLVTPEIEKAKPSVVIIKDIFQNKDREFMVNGQRIYRPQEAENERGGNWQRHDPRELFYSSHFDDLPADSVMHKCVIHLVPPLKSVPNRKLLPGFIVRKVYEYGSRRIRDLTLKDCKGSLTLKGRMECV